MLEVYNLTKTYKKTTAVDNISFSVASGEISILLGPNGAGKSTTIKAISGLINYNGEVKINGFKNTSTDAKRIFSYVPEIPHQFDYLTVMEHCDFIAKAYKVPDPSEKIKRYLTLFEMDDNKDKLGKELSKGMQQKLSIICALITEPKFIMFDEPLVGLDPKAIRTCKGLFEELKEKGVSILISTHIIDTLEEIWDKVIILNKGSVVFERTRKDFEHEYPGKNLEEIFFSITEGN